VEFERDSGPDKHQHMDVQSLHPPDRFLESGKPDIFENNGLTSLGAPARTCRAWAWHGSAVEPGRPNALQPLAGPAGHLDHDVLALGRGFSRPSHNRVCKLQLKVGVEYITSVRDPLEEELSLVVTVIAAITMLYKETFRTMIRFMLSAAAAGGGSITGEEIVGFLVGEIKEIPAVAETPFPSRVGTAASISQSARPRTWPGSGAWMWQWA
jgi:hypothetical protein